MSRLRHSRHQTHRRARSPGPAAAAATSLVAGALFVAVPLAAVTATGPTLAVVAAASAAALHYGSRRRTVTEWLRERGPSADHDSDAPQTPTDLSTPGE